MLTRDYSLRLNLKSLDESSGRFDGICATYGGPPDHVGDILEPGCFAKSIAMQPANGYPLLWAHRQDEPIGTSRISDSAGALLVSGTLLMADTTAQKAYMHLRAGSIKGISFGFTLPPESSGKVKYDSMNVRHISELFMHECSLVACPANPLAQVTNLKSLEQIENVLRTFRPGGVTASDLEQLRAIDFRLRSLLQKNPVCKCDCPSCRDDCLASIDQCEARKQQDDEEASILISFAAELKSIVDKTNISLVARDSESKG